MSVLDSLLNGSVFSPPSKLESRLVPMQQATMQMVPMQATIEVDARPASVHALTDDGAATSGLTGMEALLQRLVVYEALVPPGAVAGQRVQPHMQPHIQLTLPFGAVPNGLGWEGAFELRRARCAFCSLGRARRRVQCMLMI